MNHAWFATMQASDDDAVLGTAIRMRAILDAVFGSAEVREEASRYLAEDGLLLPQGEPRISKAQAAGLVVVLSRPRVVREMVVDGSGW